MKKKMLTVLVVIAMFVGGVLWIVPTETVERCSVLSSNCGVVTVRTDTGEIYQCYGATDAIVVDAVFDDGRLVGFDEVQ